MGQMNLENTKVQMRKGILEFCILSVLSKGEAYSSDILSVLKDGKMIVVEGTIYPLLTRLKNGGLLTYQWVESTSGPPRKYYALTKEGEAFMDGLKGTWADLVHTVELTLNRNNQAKTSNNE